VSLTQEAVRELFEYREDGNLVRRKAGMGNGNYAGRKIGTTPKMTRNSRYSMTKVHGEHWCVHKLIYLYHHGVVPKHLDHINGDTSDNRIENLREATAAQNMQNRKTFANNKSGHKGVAWSKFHSKWFVYMDVNKVRINHGYFDDLGEAALAASELRKIHHGSFASKN
jgi:hypothetical protein